MEHPGLAPGGGLQGAADLSLLTGGEQPVEALDLEDPLPAVDGLPDVGAVVTAAALDPERARMRADDPGGDEPLVVSALAGLASIWPAESSAHGTGLATRRAYRPRSAFCRTGGTAIDLHVPLHARERIVLRDDAV
ncbi:hypothetical protein ABT297_11790 [Dactylosporangium sp. NPDC000555]|uniref:hypothetical protein n=1 Tax=Dactylosporangium sp. NPDC000555 TaxID=3154260 RepID=UPI00332B2F3F